MISLALCLGVAGVLLVLAAAAVLRFSRRRPRTSSETVSLDCTVCHRPLVFNVAEMEMLSPTELALVVCTRPEVVGRKIAEYVCPHCEAAHEFLMDVRPPVWIGANSYRPQAAGGNCPECHVRFRSPSWPRGTFDGRVAEAPELAPDFGLVCSRCGAICCVACTQRHSHNRAVDALICPRCSRGPVDRFYHG
jgi:hypothetical protein